MNSNELIETLKAQIEDLRKRMPAHSIPPTMIAELDDLEEKLEEALKNHNTGKNRKI